MMVCAKLLESGGDDALVRQPSLEDLSVGEIWKQCLREVKPRRGARQEGGGGAGGGGRSGADGDAASPRWKGHFGEEALIPFPPQKSSPSKPRPPPPACARRWGVNGVPQRG